MIFRFVRTSKVNEWLQRNSPSSIVGTAGDNWKKFLTQNGGTGATFHDLEQSYLNKNNRTIHDRWSSFISDAGYTSGVFLDRIRAYFEGTLVSGAYKYLQEDGLFFYTLEDGTGTYLLE